MNGATSIPGRGDRGRWPVAVLGATGAVGQTFIRLLENHPWFELAEVAASERSAGKPYAHAARWLEGAMPERARALTVLPCDPSVVTAPIVFSALDSGVAGEVEAVFARAGRTVLSNARNFRMERDVPLLIPEVNPRHLDVLPAQRANRGWPGAIVTNGNCAAIVLATALAPLHEAFGVRGLFVATMQAVSGAGYPGVPSLDILGNVIPFIKDEEGKIEEETQKIFGALRGTIEIGAAEIAITAHANRVPVEHGHTMCVSVALDRRASVGDAIGAMESWRGAAEARGLPSAAERPLVLAIDADRPQPRRDVGTGRGMSVVVGRVRPDPVLHLKFVAMGHNTVRGAAGMSVLNAELMARRGLLPA